MNLLDALRYSDNVRRKGLHKHIGSNGEGWVNIDYILSTPGFLTLEDLVSLDWEPYFKEEEKGLIITNTVSYEYGTWYRKGNRMYATRPKGSKHLPTGFVDTRSSLRHETSRAYELESGREFVSIEVEGWAKTPKKLRRISK